MRIISLIVGGALSLMSCASPSTPTGSSQGPREPSLAIRCDASGASPLICIAVSFCGFTECNFDVTAETDWATADPGIVRQQAQPNFFEAVGEGDTVITASNSRIHRQARLPVSVFPGTAPLPTGEVWGRVTEGATVGGRPIQGATIRIRGGLIGEWTTTSGQPPAPKPGFGFVLGGANGFQFLGVPRGTYELSIEAPDYASQTRTINVTSPGSLSSHFELVRR
jgi:hypothetical protein